VVTGGEHSWLYEHPGYRRAVARMLSRACGGPLEPDSAGDIAAATSAERIPDAETKFAAMEETYGGLRSLAQVALPGATRNRPVPTETNDVARAASDPGSMPAGLAAEP
jgi:hypothetical protein